MYALLYFDTEDFFSPADSPAHTLPGQLAEIMHRHGFQGCFHIHGEKARALEQHGHTAVIEALRQHDVSLHYDRGSMHPTTAEEVSGLDWFQGVERGLYRELPGFRTIERIFGKCSALTQHGGTFGAPILYAISKLGKPFLYSPFRLPERNIVWFCDNLLIGGYQADFYFDRTYRDTPQFEATLARLDGYLQERVKNYDFTAMFGGHPVITMMQEFPDVLNFQHGQMTPRSQWVAPSLVPGVSIPLILENFERLIIRLLEQPGVEWTTVAGLRELYGRKPSRVPEAEVLHGAEAVVRAGGPSWTPALSAGEILYLLTQRVLAPASSYTVPQVMGPTTEPCGTLLPGTSADLRALASYIVQAVDASGYLPPAVHTTAGNISLENAILRLACHALGKAPKGESALPAIESIPGMAEAAAIVANYAAWGVHGAEYHPAGIRDPFRLQAWTLKPAYTEHEYAAGIELAPVPFR